MPISLKRWIIRTLVSHPPSDWLDAIQDRVEASPSFATEMLRLRAIWNSEEKRLERLNNPIKIIRLLWFIHYEMIEHKDPHLAPVWESVFRSLRIDHSRGEMLRTFVRENRGENTLRIRVLNDGNTLQFLRVDVDSEIGCGEREIAASEIGNTNGERNRASTGGTGEGSTGGDSATALLSSGVPESVRPFFPVSPAESPPFNISAELPPVGIGYAPENRDDVDFLDYLPGPVELRRSLDAERARTHLETQTRAICESLGIPLRIFQGTPTYPNPLAPGLFEGVPVVRHGGEVGRLSNVRVIHDSVVADISFPSEPSPAHEALRAELERYTAGLSRYLTLAGMSVSHSVPRIVSYDPVDPRGEVIDHTANPITGVLYPPVPTGYVTEFNGGPMPRDPQDLTHLLDGMPLPIVHSDFSFPRTYGVSRMRSMYKDLARPPVGFEVQWIRRARREYIRDDGKLFEGEEMIENNPVTSMMNILRIVPIPDHLGTWNSGPSITLRPPP